MSDFSVTAVATPLDSTAIRIVPQFGDVDTGYSQPFWFCTEIRRKFGKEPSKMMLEIRTDGWGGNAPLIAGVVNGPLDNAKGYKKVKAYMDGAIVFVGNVVCPDEDYDKDGAVVEALDCRWLLEGGNIKGSFWLENGGTSVVYREDEPAWFNRDGLPNRIKGEGGLTYAFCDSNYGIAEGTNVSDPNGNSADVATHWTPESIWVYICEVTNKAIVGSLVTNFATYWFMPDDIIMPKGAAAELKEFTKNSETPTIGLRKAAEEIFDATPVIEAIEKILNEAGPFTLGVEYGADGKSTLTIVRSKNVDGSGASLTRAIGDAEIAFAQDGVVIGGGVKRDFRQHFTQNVESGDRVYVETRVQSTDKRSIAQQQAQNVELLTAWNPATVDQIIKDFNTAFDNGYNLTVQQFIEQYPLVFEAWRLNPSKNFSLGTSEATFPSAQVTSKKILPHLLTCFNGIRPSGGEADLANSEPTTFDKLTQFLPMWIEIGDADDTPAGDGTAQNPSTSVNGETPPNPGDVPAVTSGTSAQDPGGGNPADIANSQSTSDWSQGYIASGGDPNYPALGDPGNPIGTGSGENT
jgi:hypothetical protein